MKEQIEIEEMALIMCGRESCKTCTHFIDATKCAAVVSAKKIYNAGYRKQSEGAWVYNPDGMDWGLGAWQCSLCGCNNNNLPMDNRVNPLRFAGSKFCPNCGAKMKGGAE